VASPLELFLAYKFVRIMSTPFEEWDAYKLGLIDKKGTKLKAASTSDEKNAMSLVHILARNLKRVLQKLPFGQSKLASFSAALFLLKEAQELGDPEKLLEGLVGPSDMVSESISTLPPGLYKTDPSIFEDLIISSGAFIVKEELLPVRTMFGENIFEVRDLVHRTTVLMPASLLEPLQ